jgi:hypothetical protein
MNLLDRHKADLNALLTGSREMMIDILLNIRTSKELSAEHQAIAATHKGKFIQGYQKWFTEAAAVIRQILPERHGEFVSYYLSDAKRKAVDVMMVRADLFDSELDAAHELAKHGFARGAGAIAGVVLEKHLIAVCDARGVKLKKSHPTISTMNDGLKDATVIDVPTWRFIQHLGDIRNLCDHGKGREPSTQEIDDLIAGVKKISKTVF